MSALSQASRRIILSTCPLCAGSSWSLLFEPEPGGCEWVRCECGAIYKRGEPSSAADAAEQGIGHYDDAYFERYARRRRRRIAKSRRQIRDAIEAAPRGKLLDIGCSLGYALEAARSLGLEACGVDVSEHAVGECRRLGFDARAGTLDALPFEDASFAVAILKHVFEHTPDPRSALAELRRVLTPGATAFFAVPHAGYFKAARSPETSGFFRGEAARAHYIYYSPDTLGRLLEEEGFRVATTHPCLMHRRGPLALRLAETLAAPARVPFRALADAIGLRKEFWMVAVRK